MVIINFMQIFNSMYTSNYMHIINYIFIINYMYISSFTCIYVYAFTQTVETVWNVIFSACVKQMHCNEQSTYLQHFIILILLSVSYVYVSRDLYKRYSSIFTITEHAAKVVIPESFAAKVKGWLGGNVELFDNVKDQVGTGSVWF